MKENIIHGLIWGTFITWAIIKGYIYIGPDDRKNQRAILGFKFTIKRRDKPND